MKTIWRKSIDLTEKQTITAPGLRRVLGVDDQRGVLECWFEVDTGTPERSLDLWIVGTGTPMPDEVTHGVESRYVGHLVTAGGVFVWHFYSVEVAS